MENNCPYPSRPPSRHNNIPLSGTNDVSQNHVPDSQDQLSAFKPPHHPNQMQRPSQNVAHFNNVIAQRMMHKEGEFNRFRRRKWVWMMSVIDAVST